MSEDEDTRVCPTCGQPLKDLPPEHRDAVASAEPVVAKGAAS